MTIAELGSLGEFLGSIAVLLTLVYIAVQTHQTKQAVQSSSLHTAIATMNQNTQNVVNSHEYTDIVMRGWADEIDDPVEWMRYGFWMTGMFHVFQQHFLDAEKGLGDKRIWAGEERAMKDLLGSPGVVRWWREIPARPFSDDFVAHVDSLLEHARETEEFRMIEERRKAKT